MIELKNVTKIYGKKKNQFIALKKCQLNHSNRSQRGYLR